MDSTKSKSHHLDEEGDSAVVKSVGKGGAWNLKKKKAGMSRGDEIMTLDSSDEEEDTKDKHFEEIHEKSEHEEINPTPTMGRFKNSDSDDSHQEFTTDSRRRRVSDDDSEDQHFISVKELSKLPRIEPNSRGNFLGSTHRYGKPITNFKIRVRFLKYPSLAQRSKWGDNLLVLEERVISWQQKVFSKTEVAFLMDKKNAITALDEKYRRELLSDMQSVGKYFYTYVDSDFGPRGLDHMSIIRRCAARHSRKSPKFNGGTLDKSINSDGESVVDDLSDGGEFRRSLISKKNIISLEGSMVEFLTPVEKGKTSGNKENVSEEALRQLRRKKEDDRAQKEKERLKKEATEKTKAELEEKSKKEKEIKEEIRKGRRKLKAEMKQNKFREMERRKKEKNMEILKTLGGSKRPSLALEAHMKSGMTPTGTPRLKKKHLHLSHQKSQSKKKGKSFDSETYGEDDEDEAWNTQDENESDEINSKENKRSRRKKMGESRGKSSEGDIEEILEPPLSRKQKKKGSLITTKRADTTDLSDDQNSELRKEKGREKIKKALPFQPKYKYSQSRIVRSRSRSIWRGVRSSDSTAKMEISSLIENPISMVVKVGIPHMIKRRRDMVVCSVKVFPKSGIITLKPSFGYRIIEAKRNHVYRLSWELFTDSGKENLIDKDKTRKNQERQKMVTDIEDNTKTVREDFLFGDIGDMFEIAPVNEMRLVVMGEILSAKGFEDHPICVHYIVEIPKGWRNDCVSSNLQGITQNSYTTSNSVAHFSHDFFFQLALSLDSIENNHMWSQPLILFMVVSMVTTTRVKYSGYGYITVPSQPGVHCVEIKTWTPKPRTVVDKMKQCFLNISPSLQDIRAVHIPSFEYQECVRGNRLGLETEPSGSIQLRLNVLQQTPSSIRDQRSKLELLEKMSSSTILKSVQAVIEAFQRARHRAMKVKTARSESKLVKH